MKIAVIGCTHAGTSAIINAKELYPDAEITVYERNDNISFLSCGIALYVGGVIDDAQKLFYSSPQELSEIGVKTHMRSNVLDIDIDNKKLQIENLDTNEKFEDSFDKLIITTGSWPIEPPLEGIDLENILLCKNFNHSEDITSKMETCENVVIVGAGYIGVELVEAFELKGKNVTLIDNNDRILSKYLDKEFTDVAEDAFKERGVKLALGECVTEFKGNDKGKVSRVITDKGEYEADLVIMSVGFRPNTELVKGKVDMLDNGAIIVDEYMRTNKEDVFAAGDCATIIYNPTGKREYIPLATNAVRMGYLVAKNLKEPTLKYIGTQGTSGIKIYDYSISSTGLTEERAKDEGIDIETVTIEDTNRPIFMPEYYNLTLKIVYESDSRKILGAQIISKTDLTQSINTMSVCIQKEVTIDELSIIDFFFQPHFNKPWNFLNLAGLSAK